MNRETSVTSEYLKSEIENVLESLPFLRRIPRWFVKPVKPVSQRRVQKMLSRILFYLDARPDPPYRNGLFWVRPTWYSNHYESSYGMLSWCEPQLTIDELKAVCKELEARGWTNQLNGDEIEIECDWKADL